MNVKLSRTVRSIAALLFAAVLVLATVLPAVAYNEALVRHIRLVALDSIRCGQPIRLEATVTDSEGRPVVGAQVQFRIKKGEAGDSFGPPNSASNAQGKAQTVLIMSTRRGVRQIVATVPGGPSDQLTISARAYPGCISGPGGIVLPATTVLPPTGGNLPATSTAEWLAPVVAQNLPIGAALAVAIGMLVLLSVMRRARGSRPSGTR